MLGVGNHVYGDAENIVKLQLSSAPQSTQGLISSITYIASTMSQMGQFRSSVLSMIRASYTHFGT